MMLVNIEWLITKNCFYKVTQGRGHSISISISIYLTPKTETLISLNFDSKMLDTSVLFGDAKAGGMDVDTVVTIKMATDVPPPSSHHLPEDLLRCTHTQSHGCTHKHTQTLSHKLTHKHTGTHTPSQKHTHRKTTWILCNELQELSTTTYCHVQPTCHIWVTFFTALIFKKPQVQLMGHFMNRLKLERVRLSILNG